MLPDVALAGAHDYSMLGLFLQADAIVKGVMILLIAASVVCWGIIIDKIMRFRRLSRDAGRLEDWRGHAQPCCPAAPTASSPRS